MSAGEPAGCPGWWVVRRPPALYFHIDELQPDDFNPDKFDEGSPSAG